MEWNSRFHLEVEWCAYFFLNEANLNLFKSCPSSSLLQKGETVKRIREEVRCPQFRVYNHSFSPAGHLFACLYFLPSMLWYCSLYAYIYVCVSMWMAACHKAAKSTLFSVFCTKNWPCVFYFVNSLSVAKTPVGSSEEKTLFDLRRPSNTGQAFWQLCVLIIKLSSLPFC